MGVLAGWKYQLPIIIDDTNIDANLTHFQITLKIGASVGQSSQDLTAIFDELGSDANRFKIAATKTDGTTELYIDIDYWDDATETATLHIASVDYDVPSAGDTIYFYFDSTHADNTDYVTEDSSPNVYDSNFTDIFHLNDRSILSPSKSSTSVWHSRPRTKYYNGKTYFAYVDSVLEEIHITAYTHSTKTWATPVKICDTPSTSDSTQAHMQPTLDIDSSGYIYVAWGNLVATTGTVYVYKSDSAEDISAWTALTSPASGTENGPCYAIILIDSNDYLIVFWRNNNTAYKIYSVDGGTNWTGRQTIATTTDRIYYAVCIGSDDRVHLAYSDFDTPTYYGVWYAYTDNIIDAGTDWFEADGSSWAVPFGVTADGRLLDTANSFIQTIQVNSDDKPYLLIRNVNVLELYEYTAGWNAYTVVDSAGYTHLFDSDLLITGQYDMKVITLFGTDLKKYVSTAASPSFSLSSTIAIGDYPLLVDYVEDGDPTMDLIFRVGGVTYDVLGYWVYSGTDNGNIPQGFIGTTVTQLVNSVGIPQLIVGGTKGATDQPEEVAGIVGRAQDFDGTGEKIVLSQPRLYPTGGPWTVSFWLYYAANGSYMVIGKDANYNYIQILMYANTGVYFRDAEGEVGDLACGSGLAYGTWRKFTLTSIYPGAPSIHVDGVNYGQLSATNLGSNWTIDNLGSAYAAGASATYDLIGWMDELRISKVARSDAWDKAEYYAQKDDMLTFGDIKTIRRIFNCHV